METFLVSKLDKISNFSNYKCLSNLPYIIVSLCMLSMDRVIK